MPRTGWGIHAVSSFVPIVVSPQVCSLPALTWRNWSPPADENRLQLLGDRAGAELAAEIATPAIRLVAVVTPQVWNQPALTWRKLCPPRTRAGRRRLLVVPSPMSPPPSELLPQQKARWSVVTPQV
jgi:hypothetical protein